MKALLPAGPAEVWANLQRLYPIYSALAREFAIEIAPCLDLEEALQVPSAESISGAEDWFAHIDGKIQIQQLRQFVQTSSRVNGEVLRELLIHNLDKKRRTEQDRDKADFLLVQIFADYAPVSASEAGISLQSAATLLQPVFGAIEIKDAEFVTQFEDLLDEARQYKTLNALLTARVIERGRKIKESYGDKFSDSLVMLAFSRFGFLMRSMFFRLMHQDLNAILDGLRELETRGVSAIDCRKAQFSAEEPVSRLRTICQSWKVMFHAEYSAGQPLCILVDLRTAVEAALKETSCKAKAKTAAAGAETSTCEEVKVSDGLMSTDLE
jgi:hypothetical protein